MTGVSSGRLRHAVTIEQPSGSSTDGMGNTYKEWATLYAGVPAEVRPITSEERWRADRTQAQTTHRVTLRWISGITTAMRLKFGSRYLSISGIVNTDERNIELVLDCVEVA